jgi:Flp pilus assembly protein TadD
MGLRLKSLAGIKPLRIAAMLAATVLLAANAQGQGQDSTRVIEGQVRVTNGGALPNGITVKLTVAENVVVAQQMVGTTGRFVFHDLTDKFYTVVVTADEYQTATALVDMGYDASRYPTLYLTPLGAKKTPSAPAESVTDLAAPKKARKEYEQGHDAFQAKDLAEARKHFEKAIEIDPCFARALTELGVTLTLQGDLASAETSFQKSIHCDGGFLESYLQMGILMGMEKKYAEGESVLQQALRVAPSDWQPYYRLGIIHEQWGKYKEAEQDYLKAVSLSPAVPPEVHIRLANACLQQREYESAYNEMQTYLRIAPDGPLASQTRSMLQEVDSKRKSNPEPPAGPQ